MITSITVIIVDKGVPSPTNKNEFAIFVFTNSQSILRGVPLSCKPLVLLEIPP